MSELPPDAAPEFVPDYAKPDAPGVHMGFNNTVALYYVVEADASFEAAAQGVFALLAEAQQGYPDWPRVFYVDIAGHQGEAAGFDADFYEFQQDFWFSTVAPFVSAFELPLTGGLVNPDPQRNDVPDVLNIEADTRPHAGQVIPDADATRES
ncbi:MAG: hypothetical protein AAF845_16935 [Bacteroidota bacterium]